MEEPVVLKGVVKVFKYHAEVETEEGVRYVIEPYSNGWVHWLDLHRCD